MEASGSKADQMCVDAPKTYRVILLFGPDGSVTDARARRVLDSEAAGGVLDVLDLDDAALRDSPGRLIDETRALSLFGERRAIRLKVFADPSQKALKALLAETELAPEQDRFLTIGLAGDLPKRHGLRKAFAESRHGLALPSYPDDASGLRRIAKGEFDAQGVAIDAEALDEFLALVEPDRSVIQREIDKLALAVMDRSDRRVSRDDVVALSPTAWAPDMLSMVDAAVDGDANAAVLGLQRVSLGSDLQGALRLLIRRLQDLHAIKADPKGVEAAVDSLVPRPFGLRRTALIRTASRWRADRLRRAVSETLAAEAACRVTGSASEAHAARAFLATARLGAPNR